MDDKICLECMALSIADTVLEVFTETHPGVVMNYDQWRYLAFVIRETVKDAFDGDVEPVVEKVMIQ